MNSVEKMNTVTYLENQFFEYAYNVFIAKHGEDSGLAQYVKQDNDYLIKYYNNYTKIWLSMLDDDYLKDLLNNYMKNSVKSGSGNKESYLG